MFAHSEGFLHVRIAWLEVKDGTKQALDSIKVVNRLAPNRTDNVPLGAKLRHLEGPSHMLFLSRGLV